MARHTILLEQMEKQLCCSIEATFNPVLRFEITMCETALRDLLGQSRGFRSVTEYTLCFARWVSPWHL